MQQPAIPIVPPRCPRLVTFIAVLLLAQAIFVVLAGIIVTMTVMVASSMVVDIDETTAVSPLTYLLPALSAATTIVIGGGLLLAGIGLLGLRAWAWILAMVFQCLGLVLALYLSSFGQVLYPLLVFPAFVIVLLNLPGVRRLFGLARRPR